MVGSFALDDLKEYMPVHLQSTSEVHHSVISFISLSRT